MSQSSWSWDRCAATCERLFESLDWQALGAIYFHQDGEAHWQQRRTPLLELGFQWARELLRRVGASGRSLYIGAGLAELPVLVVERCLGGREVRAVNKNRRECELLARGLRAAGLGELLAIEPADAGSIEASGYDHLGCVSVFTDPQAWPMLSGVAYGRLPPVQVDVDKFVRERDAARALARRLFAGLTRPGWITTTAEEVAWFLEQADLAQVPYTVDDAQVPTAVVGDPIGFLRIG
jgi:hypothetical protein